MGYERYIHKIIQNNYNAKIFLDNYGGSADQLDCIKR